MSPITRLCSQLSRELTKSKMIQLSLLVFFKKIDFTENVSYSFLTEKCENKCEYNQENVQNRRVKEI